MLSLYHVSARPIVRQQIEAGEYSMQQLLDAAQAAPLRPPPDWPERPGVNTPDDLARLAGA